MYIYGVPFCVQNYLGGHIADTLDPVVLKIMLGIHASAIASKWPVTRCWYRPMRERGTLNLNMVANGEV